MFIAKVIGKIVATQKADKLTGAKLLIIKELNEYKEIAENNTLVAIDGVGAGIDDIVLVDWGDTLYENSKLSVDMAIVGIVDEIQLN